MGKRKLIVRWRQQGNALIEVGSETALAGDLDVMRYTGAVLVAASVAANYGFTDIDGKSPRPLTLADV